MSKGKGIRKSVGGDASYPHLQKVNVFDVRWDSCYQELPCCTVV
jgi:hypothetical protein